MTMTRIAQVHPSSTISPTKDELCAQFSTIVERLGGYRAVDPDGEVGIEVILGLDAAGRLTQLPLTYRAADNALPEELTAMSHSVLGQRSIARAEADPVAVAEWTRIITESDSTAEYSSGAQRFTGYGTGPLVGSGSQGGGSAEFLLHPIAADAAPGQLRIIDTETGAEYVAARLA